MGKKKDLGAAERRAVERAAFAHAREKDQRQENGITGRVDFMLDQKNASKKGKR